MKHWFGARPAALATALWLVLSPAAQAGSSCEQRAIGPSEIQQAMRMADRTRQFLDASGAKLALVGRVGSDLSPHGLRYTHAGAVLRDHPAGPWTFVHLLNECGADRSGIYDEGLVNFFLDDLFAFEAVVAVPSAAVQQRMIAALEGPTATALHQSAYSLIANPFSTRYQNSNQWLLEVLATALPSETTVKTRAQAQALLALRGFEPDEIRVGGLQRLGASLTRANVRFDDHDDTESAAGRYRAVTVRSLIRFLRQVDTVAQPMVIGLQGEPQPATRY